MSQGCVISSFGRLQRAVRSGTSRIAAVVFAIALVQGLVTVLGTSPAEAGRKIVSISEKYELGSIVVVNSERKLYYVIGKGRALLYPVAVGTKDSQWTGQSFVQSKAVNPSWIPPWAPNRVVRGGAGNPLGARALYLGWTQYRIHGTNAPGSIGSAASHGCFRMFNEDVKDLYSRVHIGAPVYVLNRMDDES